MTTALLAKHPYLLAVVMAVTANFTLSVMNATVKVLALGGYDTFQITFTNGVIGFSCLLGWLLWRGELKRVRTREPLLLVYVAVSLGTCFCLFRAFGTGHIAEVSTVMSAAPLIIAVMSYIFLSERMTAQQLGLAVTGFLGVLLVLKPRPELTDYTPLLLALGGAFLFSASQICVKKLTGRVFTLAFTFYFYGSLVVCAGSLMHLVPVTAHYAPLFLLSGACDVTSLVLLYSCYRYAPASLVAPFNYTNILWTALFGYIIWAERGDAWTLAGASLVIASGVFFARTMFQPLSPEMPIAIENILPIEKKP